MTRICSVSRIFQTKGLVSIYVQGWAGKTFESCPVKSVTPIEENCEKGDPPSWKNKIE